MHFLYQVNANTEREISPWHDIPFSGREGQYGPTLNFVCEIPKGATGKLQRIGLATKLGLG